MHTVHDFAVAHKPICFSFLAPKPLHRLGRMLFACKWWCANRAKHMQRKPCVTLLIGHKHQQVAACTAAVQVLYVPNITQGVFDVLTGRVDVALVRADLLVRLQNQGQLVASDFKTLSPVSPACN